MGEAKDPQFKEGIDDQVDKLEFQFRGGYGVNTAGENVYEATWQTPYSQLTPEQGGSFWFLLADSVNGSVPWPGSRLVTNEETGEQTPIMGRYAYIPTGGESETPGEFLETQGKFTLLPVATPTSGRAGLIDPSGTEGGGRLSE